MKCLEWVFQIHKLYSNDERLSAVSDYGNQLQRRKGKLFSDIYYRMLNYGLWEFCS